MPKKKKPPIVNAVTLCVNHNWPDHKWVLDIEACPQDLEWSSIDKTYYSKDAIKEQEIFTKYIWLNQYPHLIQG